MNCLSSLGLCLFWSPAYFLAERGQLFKVGLSAASYFSANLVNKLLVLFLHFQNRSSHKFSVPCLEIAAVNTFYRQYDSIFLSGDIQDPPRRGPVQPAVGDPVSAGDWTRWPTEVPSNPEHSVILWFCDINKENKKKIKLILILLVDL